MSPLRRSCDVAVALAALVILSPVILAAALIVRLDSPGWPFFGGRRAGRHGRPFRMWKIRTMVRHAERGGPITARGDARVTRAGRFLRRSKLDELPQFVNLLFGDLTLVGPRPEAPEIVARYTAEQRRVLAGPPGVTGPTAVLYTLKEADSIPVDGAEEHYLRHILSRKLELELSYLRTRTVWTDLRVVAATVELMLRGVLGLGGVPTLLRSGFAVAAAAGWEEDR